MPAKSNGRSELLLDAGRCVLAVIDLQERLLPTIPEATRLTERVKLLIASAQLVKVPIITTEQYPKGLGPTIEPLRPVLSAPIEKTDFSAAGCAAFVQNLAQLQVDQIVLAGIETHVCVQQTAMDLLTLGYQVHVPIDAVGARHALDHQTALTRLQAAGVILTTVEAALFEWARSSRHPEFKAISQLVKRADQSQLEKS